MEEFPRGCLDKAERRKKGPSISEGDGNAEIVGCLNQVGLSAVINYAFQIDKT
jgi:hypothetical protein